MTNTKFPKPEDIKNDLEEFIKKNLGGQVQMFSNHSSPDEEKPQTEDQGKGKHTKKNQDFSFHYTPKQIKEYLDRFVIDQDEPKKALAVAVCDHYNQIKAQRDMSSPTGDHYCKQNLLILGPTGVGKTYMVRQLAKLIGVPFVKGDATRFSETGYMGANVEDLIKDLVTQADNDIQKAQYGIVYLDEVDKLARPLAEGQRDVSGRGVQLGLLKLMEETEVDLRAGNDPSSQIQAFMELQQKGKVEKQVINTKHILFITSGAFVGLDKMISQRLNKSPIGFKKNRFQNPDEERHLLSQATTDDFISYGLEPEFVGRLPTRVACHNLNEDQLFQILSNSEGSIINQYKQSFSGYQIKVDFTEQALREIARLAAQEKTGARGLLTICERILRHYKFELPSSSLKTFTVTDELVKDPERFLKKILSNTSEKIPEETLSSIKNFEKDFQKTFNLTISFDESAINHIHQVTKNHKKNIETYCSETLRSYEHGLKLIEQNTGKNQFFLGEKNLKNPSSTLEVWIKESYN